ncbi:T9SS type A sorting domain-containing protein [uncultured Marixanthomonas sp.]|uniref:T9SS type A sorting domain-containing protein n=1 Tax=uncultured Marixanthomonas sp. TaxID=757245 RepID=UPI0030DD9793|tara:strand:+ start:39331 stop:41088 length:1758 start_codon:yes stop_codon:yes gene_type:complete
MKLRLTKEQVIMKNAITLLLCSLFVFTGMAQTASSGTQMDVPERTTELKALYQQAKQLENNGTAAEINANRLAIKNAWQEVNPAIAALYKPVETGNLNGLTILENEISTEDAQPIARSPEDWGTDILIHDDFVDGLDMDVTGDGDIYITSYKNLVGGGVDVNTYRSLNGGISFSLWKSISFGNINLLKLQTILMDGNGEEYLLLYTLGDNGILSPIRLKISNGNIEAGPAIVGNLTDFSMDRNYPINTSNQRIFAIYLKEDTACSEGGRLFSARSTAGSYGFDWLDETEIPVCAKQVDFAYGRDGGCYTTFIGGNSGKLYANFNPNYNDPGSWAGDEVIINPSSNQELSEPTIRAARKIPANDHVIIGVSLFSQSIGKVSNETLLRENGGSYSSISTITPSNDGDFLHIDGWVRRQNTVDVIQTAYLNTDNTANNIAVSRTYEGDGTFESSEIVSDPNIDVFEGLPTVVAETADGEPCMAYASTSSDGTRGYGLYFDSRSTLGVGKNKIDHITMYPNPAKDIVNLKTENTIENISIYSQLGQKVIQVSPGQKNTALNVTSLATGSYFVEITTTTHQTVVKQIVKK